MRRHLISIVLIFASAICIADDNKTPWENMEFIGEGKLRFLMWDIYRATLYSSAKNYQPGIPFALNIRYLRAVKKNALLKETQKQWRRLNSPQCDDGKEWLSNLEKIWQDVEKSDSLTLLVDDTQHASFYFNENLLGKIQDKEFSKCFSDIWLSPDTSRPKLRKKLLGVNK